MGTKIIIADQRQRVGDWVAPRVKRLVPWHAYEAIGLELDGELIAGVVFDSYVKNARCCMHVAAEGKRWLNREFLWFCFHYAFEQLKCNAVIGLVDADNEQALKFDENLGFMEVGRIEGGAGDCDLVVLSMQRRMCRWLEIKK